MAVRKAAGSNTVNIHDAKTRLSQLIERGEAASATGFVELPITSAHAARLTTLPDLHRDPFDRLLIAQAVAESAVLLTNDVPLGRYSKQVRVF